jgi:hypothetical protein
MSTFSQFGQAEWLLQLAKTMGIAEGSVFEAGAASPHAISNSRCFINAGWQSYLVEASTEHCKEWESLNLRNVVIYNKKINYDPSGIDSLLSEIKVPYDLDVFFLDIDGGEYQLLEGMNSFRPKLICAEYDNSYPLSIDFVPRQIRHSVESAQCSSRAMFRLMSEKGYTYIKSFFLDHIFIANEVIGKNQDNPDLQLVGRKAFCKLAPRHLYDFRAVLLNQDAGKGGNGVEFFQRKLLNLVEHGYIQEASHYYFMLSQIFHSYCPLVVELRGDGYGDAYIKKLEIFDSLYGDALFYPVSACTPR